MVLLNLLAFLSIIVTFVISKVAKRRYGDWSTNHLKWELTNSISFLITCLSGVVIHEPAFLFWTHIFLFVLFAGMVVIEGMTLWERVNNRKNIN